MSSTNAICTYLPLPQQLLWLTARRRLTVCAMCVGPCSERLARENHPIAGDELPALTIGFPITPPAKPWYWWPTFFFTLYWRSWHRIREQLPDACTLRPARAAASRLRVTCLPS